MGCCQTNLASPNHPANINPRDFIDRIKEDWSMGNGERNMKNKKNNKNKTQSEEEYEYSVHGLRQGEENEESSVSIFDEQRRLRSEDMSGEGKRKMGHVEIHPQIVGEQPYEKAEKSLQPSVQQVAVNNNNKQSFQQSCQQFPISRIDLLHPGNNFSHQDSHILNKQISSFSLLHDNSNENHQFLNQKDTCKAIQNQTDREMVVLNDEIATMIVMWDKGKGEGRRLRLGTMKNQQSEEGKEEKGQVDEKDKNGEEEDDRELLEIWKEQKQEQLNEKSNKLYHQQQVNDEQDRLKNLKNEYILQPNLHQPQTNKPTKQKYLLTNHKMKQNLEQKQPKKVQNPKGPQKQPNQQQLKLHLSKMKSRAKQQQPLSVFNLHLQQESFSNQQSQQGDEEFTHCLLSNPTKILNDSFVEEFNQEKELFYFGDKRWGNKWIESDRKAFQVNKGVLEMFLFEGNNQHNNNLLSSQENQKTTTISTKKPATHPLTHPFCILLSIIRDYYHLTGINLIAYRTFSSTSIFFEPQQRESNYSGFRIFYNGTKRIFPYSECFDCTQIAEQLWKMVGILWQKERSLAQVMYNLTGWIPEFIVVEEINSFEGIFERLNNNFVQSNTIITFSGKRGQNWGLKSINLQNKQITLYGKALPSSSQQQPYKHINQFEQTHSWQQFTNMISSINVNWNPLIYEYIWRTENIFFSHQSQSPLKQKDSIPQHDPAYISHKSHQYLLKIPPSDDDIELRVFLETHFDDLTILNSQSQPLVVELYDYMGARIHTLTSAIRKIDKKKAVYSDVLIFEGSRQRTEYVLMVRPDVPSYCHQVKFTISAYSFFEVGLSELTQQRVVEQKKITTFLQQSHCGYGINSPYFLDNFYMQLKVPLGERVKIYVEMPSNQCCFEINLVANPQCQQNLTRLNLQTILNDIITSEEFNHGKGYLQVETRHEQYFLMLTNHTKCKGQFKIFIQVLEKQPKALTKEKLEQIQVINSNKDQFLPNIISYKERFFYQQPLVKKEFKWSPVNTGPRKRLKSNTHSGYQPYVTFKEFFKNPYTDFKLQAKKKYQFSVVSQSFKQEFDKILQQEDKNDSQPPTLSLGILKMAKPDGYNQNHEKANESSWSFKIVLDDAFYVPFGFGFWTKAMEFEEGEYRFVFPRMEKESGLGVFCVYEAGQ